MSSQWKVPRTKANLFNQQVREQILTAIEPAVFGSSWEALDIVHAFEKGFGDLMGYPYVNAVQSGSSALLLALKAAGVGIGDEVITVANSDMATTNAIGNCGAICVLCDVNASDYTMNVDLVESLITERTRAILPVDLYGHPVDGRRLREIADRYNLMVVEDAALATAAKDYGKPVGAFAQLVVFSTAPTKQIGSVGSGGMVATWEKSLWDGVESYKRYGLSAETNEKSPDFSGHIVEGYHLRMVPVDAAVLNVKLKYLPEWTEKRKKIARWYQERLKNVDGVRLPVFRPESEPVCREFVVMVRNRDVVLAVMRGMGIQANTIYNPPVHRRPVYQKHRYPGANNLPVTEALATQLLNLPIDPLLEEKDIDFACEALIAGLKQ